MDQLLLSRERGQRGRQRHIGSHESLVRRLKHTARLENRAPASAAAFCHEGLLVVAGEDCTLRLWDTDRGTLLQYFDPVRLFNP